MRRIAGVDLARALAIIGMFAVHIGPTLPTDPLEHVYALPHGRSALLFVVVAGVGISLLAASPRASRSRTNLTLLWRAALLLPAGLALQELDHEVAVILQSYALLFVLAIVLLRLPSRWLLALAALSVTAGSVGYLRGRMLYPEQFDRLPVALTDPMADIIHRLVLSGPYPLVTWLAPFVLGIVLGRLDLRAPEVRRRLVWWGIGVTVGAALASRGLMAMVGAEADPTGWERLLIDAPHSQMPLWLIGASATAVALVGGCLVLADRLARTVRPLVLVGQLALTVYVAHLLALHVAPEMLTSDEVGPAVVVLALFLAGSILFSLVWRGRFRRGPLELALQLPPRPRRRSRPTGPGA